jgi:hypothetical protein
VAVGALDSLILAVQELVAVERMAAVMALLVQVVAAELTFPITLQIPVATEDLAALFCVMQTDSLQQQQ